MDAMRQSVCLIVNPITVYSYGCRLNFTKVAQPLDSITTLTLIVHRWVGAWSRGYKTFFMLKAA